MSHTNRENMHGNSGMNPVPSHQNQYFMQRNIKDVYQEIFQKAVDTYNAKQKRKDRKMINYYDKIKKNTRIHEQGELVVAIGEGKDDLKYREAKKEALKEYAEVFQKRNPNLAVYHMVLHDDEANPYLHINYVPNFESNQGLTRRVGMDRALQQQGIKGKGTERIANWRKLEKAYIEELAKEHIPDFERAKAGSHNSTKIRQDKEYAETKSRIENQVQEKEMGLQMMNHYVEKAKKLQIVKEYKESDVVDTYKELQAVEQQVENEKPQLTGQQYVELEKMVKQEQKEWDRVMDQLPNEQIYISFSHKEVETIVHDKLFWKSEIIKRETQNYVLTPEQYEEVTKQVNAAVTIKKDYERLKQTDFVKENESLRMVGEYLTKENSTLQEEKSQLQNEIEVLHTEISSLKA